MTYEPYQYAETKILHQLFKEKFGKVWENQEKIKYVDDTIYSYVSKSKGLFSCKSNTVHIDSSDILPALTLSSFCEFVDDVFGDSQIQNFHGSETEGLYLLNIYDINITKMTCTISNINTHLKHFAVDHWDEPEKIIEEVKKYL